MAKSAMKVSIVDKGLDRLLARVSAKDDAAVEVGVLDAADAETVLIAQVHELGLGNAPQRSFLRATVTKNRQRYAELSKRAYAKFVDGDWSLVQALTAVGEEIRSDIQKTIIKGIPPRLQTETVKSKRRRGLPRPGTALYATGKLYEAIKARLVGVR